MKTNENGNENEEVDDEEIELKENAKERSKINKKGYYEEQDEIKKRFIIFFLQKKSFCLKLCFDI